jgi:hypothetical protein
MTRKLKALGLVLIGVLALVALAAASGWAGEEGEEEQNKPKRFETLEASPTEPAHLTGFQSVITTSFTFGEGKAECGLFKLTGKMEAKEVKELTMTPSYSEECKAFGRESHFEFNGCDFLFTLKKGTYSTGPVLTHTQGPVHIKCPDPKNPIAIKVTEPKGTTFCTIKIFDQTPTEPEVDQKNAGESVAEVQLTFTVKKLHYEVTGGGGACGETGKTLSDGKIDSVVTLASYKSKGGQQAIFVKGELDPDA